MCKYQIFCFFSLKIVLWSKCMLLSRNMFFTSHAPFTKFPFKFARNVGVWRRFSGGMRIKTGKASLFALLLMKMFNKAQNREIDLWTLTATTVDAFATFNRFTQINGFVILPGLLWMMLNTRMKIEINYKWKKLNYGNLQKKHPSLMFTRL